MASDQDYLDKLRHSAAHLLAAAVMELYPKAKRAIGPATKDGFYYDFDNLKISEEDLPKIEKKMRQILPSWKSFEKKMLDSDEAKKAYPDNPFKHELIDDFSQNGKKKISFYLSCDYQDLCRGGHVDNPSKEIKAFKLLSIAGAYWRGSEKNKMLTRIYGTAFASQKELDHYLWQQKEAKKRDHRKLGAELELFIIKEEVGPGLPLWLPKGNIVKEELENWAKQTEADWGYQRVSTPHITKDGLYHTSGHLPYYKGDMFPPMELDDGEKYYLKPMNCPHHHMIYGARKRSYRELPLRLSEYGMCYRYESSGELFGLMRVRSLNINDAHIYCTEDQAVEEFAQVMRLHEHFYKALGITDYHLEMALRDPKNKKKYHGDEAMWVKAEKLMRQAVAKVNIPMVEEEGSAAFYGPKIDFIIHSSIGREFAVSTNQIDLFMGGQFKLKYTDRDGKETTPAIIHRAPLGSHERFIGFLIEHFGGAFPLWLHPTQVTIVPVSQKQNDYASKITKVLSDSSVRVEVNNADNTMQAKIRAAEEQKVPYILIVGDKEIKEKAVSVRGRGKKDLGQMTIDQFAAKIGKEIKRKAIS
jgi:threonyl-tRNA synthetase